MPSGQAMLKNAENDDATLSIDPVDREFHSARRGDRPAFGRMVQLLQDRLYNAIYRMTGDPDEALDLTQETFTRALAGIRAFRGDSKPYTWLFRIAMNLSISSHRKKARRKTISLDGSAEPQDQATSLKQTLAGQDPSPDDLADHHEQVARLYRAMDMLASDERVILVMRDIDGMDYKQIAAVLEVPVGTVKSRLFRARMALRNILEPDSHLHV